MFRVESEIKKKKKNNIHSVFPLTSFQHAALYIVVCVYKFLGKDTFDFWYLIRCRGRSMFANNSSTFRRFSYHFHTISAEKRSQGRPQLFPNAMVSPVASLLTSREILKLYFAIF